MSYRPITDIWLLTRCKYKGGVKRFGGYLGGFPERARALLGCSIYDPVLHVCGGLAKLYPYKNGFGPNDKTLDLDPACEPDYMQDAREPFPQCPSSNASGVFWAGILIDPPYSPEDAASYPCGSDAYPSPNLLLKNAFEVIGVGSRVGIIHYQLPKAPKNSRFVAAVGVLCGFNNRIRCYSVFERTE